jgi:CRISPR system Cascade subunit CasD
MTEPILLLRLEGPLQSWGVRSRWSRRDTGPEPSKSAIIGLLGCAAGILRPDWRSGTEPDRTLEQWDNALRFGVRIDRPGTIETDYHTVQGRFWQADGNMKTASHVSGAKPDKAEREPPHTEVTWRDYLHDAAFLVVLALKPEHGPGNRDLLGHLKERLQDPKWPLYLGRKSCVPTRPIFYRLTDEYDDFEIALHKVPWAPPRSPRSLQRAKQSPELLAWIECQDGGRERPDEEYERQDSLRLNQLRFYDFRRCRRIVIPAGSVPCEPVVVEVPA